MIIHLEPLSFRYTDAIYKNIKNKSITATYPVSKDFTKEEAKQYVEHEIGARSNGSRFSYAITSDNIFSGICAFYNIDHQYSKAKIYYWVVARLWNRGIATNAVQQLICLAQKMNISQLQSGVLERNHSSRRVLEKNGFFIENIVLNKGKYHSRFYNEKILEMKLNLSN